MSDRLTTLESIVMPFGKYEGDRLGDVPLAYLDWLVGKGWLRNPLKSEVVEYLSHPTIARELASQTAAQEDIS